MIKLHARRSESVFGSPTRSARLAGLFSLGVPPRLRWASWGRSAVRDARKLKCRRFESVRIESSVDPLQLDPKMFSAPADAAVSFSQLPGTLRPSMRALGGVGTVQASLHALCSR